MYKKLSIIIPIYNEKKTVLEIIRQVDEQEVSLEKEIILIDDCSKDGTRDILTKFQKKVKKDPRYKILFHDVNKGKGAAVRTGLKSATGDIFIIQDADLEYHPKEYPRLLEPILKGKTKVVYGSRFMSKKGHLKENQTFTYMLHAIGNKGLTITTNILYSTKLTDMETCYKVFTREVYTKMPKLRAKRFDLEPEITAKIAKSKFKIIEVPIDYYSRDFSEGKKITWKDGVKALYYLIKYRIMN